MPDTFPPTTDSPALAALAPAPLVQLDADLQLLRAKREARIRRGLLAEYGHLLHDVDPDAATRPFPCLDKGISARILDGGQS